MQFSGYLVHNLIPDGRWWQFLYCSGLNTLNLVVCLIGAGMFAKTSVFILAIVCSCLGTTIFSFFYQGFIEVSFVNIPNKHFNATFVYLCELNCSKSKSIHSFGFFVIFLAAMKGWGVIILFLIGFSQVDVLRVCCHLF